MAAVEPPRLPPPRLPSPRLAATTTAASDAAAAHGGGGGGGGGLRHNVLAVLRGDASVGWRSADVEVVGVAASGVWMSVTDGDMTVAAVVDEATRAALVGAGGSLGDLAAGSRLQVRRGALRCTARYGTADVAPVLLCTGAVPLCVGAARATARVPTLQQDAPPPLDAGLAAAMASLPLPYLLAAAPPLDGLRTAFDARLLPGTPASWDAGRVHAIAAVQLSAFAAFGGALRQPTPPPAPEFVDDDFGARWEGDGAPVHNTRLADRAASPAVAPAPAPPIACSSGSAADSLATAPVDTSHPATPATVPAASGGAEGVRDGDGDADGTGTPTRCVPLSPPLPPLPPPVPSTPPHGGGEGTGSAELAQAVDDNPSGDDDDPRDRSVPPARESTCGGGEKASEASDGSGAELLPLEFDSSSLPLPLPLPPGSDTALAHTLPAAAAAANEYDQRVATPVVGAVAGFKRRRSVPPSVTAAAASGEAPLQLLEAGDATGVAPAAVPPPPDVGVSLASLMWRLHSVYAQPRAGAAALGAPAPTALPLPRPPPPTSLFADDDDVEESR